MVISIGGVDCLGEFPTLEGVSVLRAKTLLRDAFGIPYFAEAAVNGRPALAHQVLRAGDRLRFCKRYGVKAGDDRPGEEAEAKALLDSYPELEAIIADVAALDRPYNRKLDVLVLRVFRWAEARFGPVTADVADTLHEVSRRLGAQVDEWGRLAGRSGEEKVGPVHEQRPQGIQVHEAEGVIALNGVWHDVEPVYLAVLDCLVTARGGWVSGAEMQRRRPLLRDEERIDRLIARLRKDHWRLGQLVEALPGRGYRIAPP